MGFVGVGGLIPGLIGFMKTVLKFPLTFCRPDAVSRNISCEARCASCARTSASVGVLLINILPMPIVFVRFRFFLF